MIKILVVVANGTEEIEAVVPVDLFRRAGFDVVLAGTEEFVMCSRGVVLKPDYLIVDIPSDCEFDLLFLPGGRQGVETLVKNAHFKKIVMTHFEKGKKIAAICAAPLILIEYGIYPERRPITSHPSISSQFEKYEYKNEPIVIEEPFFTSRGAGTSIEFALTLIESFAGKEIAKRVAQEIVYPHF
ncbi:MAG: DJ-1/PfpI family protein [Ignavibacteria bacterium]|nr:DJ-1/PfpI family protein [Ignavibacteria bacterium]